MSHTIAHSGRVTDSAPDTSHVPCKFFRQGACQAGNACPFSHDLNISSENVCKYFAKVRPPNSVLAASNIASGG